MRQLDFDSIRSESVGLVGLDPARFKIESPEFIAASIRRIASSLCPCTSSELTRTFCEVTAPIIECSPEDLRQRSVEMIESLIGNGDLIESHEVETSLGQSRRGRVLYLRPPSFVRRQNNSVFLVGIPPGNSTVLPTALEKRIDHFSHVRRLSPESTEDVAATLRALGLTELSIESWDRRNLVPEIEKPVDYINKIKSRLADNPGSLDGLEILEPATPVRYYSRRWALLSKQTGVFVARRPQAFGNALWCFVEVQGGTPTKILDFPVLSNKLPGRDEAWRLQMAIDAELGNPQEFSVIPSGEPYRTIRFYSPVPSWAQRRWDNLAEPAGNDGCLFSYRFPVDEFPQERKFLTEYLWMAEVH